MKNCFLERMEFENINLTLNVIKLSYVANLKLYKNYFYEIIKCVLQLDQSLFNETRYLYIAVYKLFKDVLSSGKGMFVRCSNNFCFFVRYRVKYFYPLYPLNFQACSTLLKIS